jgi:hypothetical protein
VPAFTDFGHGFSGYAWQFSPESYFQWGSGKLPQRSKIFPFTEEMTAAWAISLGEDLVLLGKGVG